MRIRCADFSGGYYTIEQKGNRLRIIVLNTNLFSAAAGSDDDPAGQWTWLENTLEKSRSNALGGPWKVKTYNLSTNLKYLKKQIPGIHCGEYTARCG